MLRWRGVLFVFLCCGNAVAADLELQPKPGPSERALPAPPAPQSPPLQLQTTEPLPLPAPDRKEQPASTEQKPIDTLQPPQASAPPPGESWWQQIVRNAPNCKYFSDGCRRCDVNFQCSGLPIACQPKEFTCADSPP